MRMTSCATALLAVAVVAFPVGAAIKAMNLAELMSVTDDAVHGTIVQKETVRLDAPWQDAVYTQITIEGTSLRTGEVGQFEVLFHGSHERSDDYVISEMPTLQDSRLGGTTVVFFEKGVEELGGKNLAHNWANLYRVEQVFGAPVLIGKGEGSAFVLNTAVTEVSSRVANTHVDLAKNGKKTIPGMGK
jgi:hypothetical protein